MKKKRRKLFAPPSLRLNAVVICEVVVLLVASLAVLFYFSYETMKVEAMKDADQTLEGTVQHVDNVLLSVEQSAGNVYHELLMNLGKSDRMPTYCRRLVECNSYIQGCAIAFKPGFYPGREQFMTYVHRKGSRTTEGNPQELVTADAFGNRPYTEQEWYTATMASGRACWIGPLEEEEDEGETLSFCLPIYSSGKIPSEDGNMEVAGVFVIDLSVELLSEIVLAAKPTPNSYCAMLNHRGGYIIHSDMGEKKGKTVFDILEKGYDPALRETVEAMVAGKTGGRLFRMDGNSYYACYKPFVRNAVEGRSAEDLQWSIALIYPERDVFGMFRYMIGRVLVVSVAGLLLFFLLCRIAFGRQMKPLREITESAQRIADGHYDDPVSDSQRNDEIGTFRQHFREMQVSLASRISELEHLKAIQQERGEKLRETHDRILKSGEVKTTLFRQTVDDMEVPCEAILKSVDNLCDNYQTISMQEADGEVAAIRQQSEAILALLNQMLYASGEEAGKEASHV